MYKCATADFTKQAAVFAQVPDSAAGPIFYYEKWELIDDSVDLPSKEPYLLNLASLFELATEYC